MKADADALKLNDPSRNKAHDDAASMAQDVIKAEKDLADLRETSNNQKQAILVEARTSMEDIGSKGQTAFADAGKKVIEEMQASVTRTGQQLTATEKSNMDELQKLITDRIDDSKQMDRFKVLIDNLHGARVTSDAAVNSALEKLTDGWDAQMKIINPLIIEIDRLKQEQVNMLGRINGLSVGRN